MAEDEEEWEVVEIDESMQGDGNTIHAVSEVDESIRDDESTIRTVSEVDQSINEMVDLVKYTNPSNSSKDVILIHFHIDKITVSLYA